MSEPKVLDVTEYIGQHRFQEEDDCIEESNYNEELQDNDGNWPDRNR